MFDFPYILFKGLISSLNLVILTYTVITSSAVMAVAMLMLLSWIETCLDLHPSEEELATENI